LKITSEDLHIHSKGEGDMIDLTDRLRAILSRSGLKDGLMTVFVPGSTAAVTTIEYEPGLRRDFPDMLERVAPKSIPYEHEKTWHDGNGHSHVKAALIGPSVTIPFRDGRLTLGTWQQVVLIELDIHSRSRILTVQLIGE